MERFKLVDPGARDKHSKTGYAAPSWRSFRGCVWGRADDEGCPEFLTLENLRNRPGRRASPGKIADYEVIVWGRDDKPRISFVGHDWQALVRVAKRHCYGTMTDEDREFFQQTVWFIGPGSGIEGPL